MPINNSFLPTQIGYTPTGSVFGSQVYIGRDLTGTWDAIGLGSNGRPDYLETLQINLSLQNEGKLIKIGQVLIDTFTLNEIFNNNPNVPNIVQISFKEVSVCDNGITKKMIILASDTYDP